MTGAELADLLKRGPWQLRMHLSVTGWSIYQHRLVADRRIEQVTKIPKKQGKPIEKLIYFEDNAVDVDVSAAAPGRLILGVRQFSDIDEAAAAIVAHDMQIAVDRAWERSAP